MSGYAPTNDLRNDIDAARRMLIAGAPLDAVCAPIDSFLRQVLGRAGSPELTVAQAEQLSTVNEIEVLLGCYDPGGATVYLDDETYFTTTRAAAETDLVA